MILVPGNLVATFTFPGVIMHELSHVIMCKLCKVRIIDVNYFKFLESNAGYVEHEACDNPYKNALISFGPLFINSIVAILISLSSSINIFILKTPNILDIIILWVAISIGMNALPSVQDIKNASNQIWNSNIFILIKLLIMPIIFIVFICSILKVVWFDAVYAIGLIYWAPIIIEKLI